MLTIQVVLQEGFDEEKQEFVIHDSCSLELEHSLVSLSKWESFFEKPFLNSEKTTEETIWYVKAMTLTPNVPPEIYDKLSQENFEAIRKYVESKQTATWFREDPNVSHSREIITAEKLYYWMVASNVPFECQYWHLNKLITLLRVCREETAPKKKVSREEAARRMHEMNERRLAELGTTG